MQSRSGDAVTGENGSTEAAVRLKLCITPQLWLYSSVSHRQFIGYQPHITPGHRVNNEPIGRRGRAIQLLETLLNINIRTSVCVSRCVIAGSSRKQDGAGLSCPRQLEQLSVVTASTSNLIRSLICTLQGPVTANYVDRVRPTPSAALLLHSSRAPAVARPPWLPLPPFAPKQDQLGVVCKVPKAA